jgi:tetratricopeptide (TPR) repeat protein
MARTQTATTTQPDSFPTLFKTYVVRSVQATLVRVNAETHILPEEGRERALHVLTYAFELPEAWPYTRELLLALAPKMEQAGHRDDWIPYLEEGVRLSQHCDDRLAEANLRLSVGELLRLRSQFDRARQWLDASIAIFTAVGERHGQARTLNQLAFVAWQQHHLDEAKDLAQRALTLLDEGDPERATCFSRLGLVAIDRQQWEEAERYHRAALQIRQAQGNQRQIAWSLQNLGYALRGQGKYTEAITCYKQAIAILEEIQDTANHAIAQMNLGIACWLAGQLDTALEMYSLSESTSRKLQDTYNLAKIFNNKGLVYRDLGDWIQAESAFVTSIALHEAVGDFNLRLESLDELGVVYLGQGEYDKASTCFAVALTELPQIAGSPTYNYLAEVLPIHLAQARQQKESSQNEFQCRER